MMKVTKIYSNPSLRNVILEQKDVFLLFYILPRALKRFVPRRVLFEYLYSLFLAYIYFYIEDDSYKRSPDLITSKVSGRGREYDSSTHASTLEIIAVVL